MADEEPKTSSELKDGIDVQSGQSTDLVLDTEECEEQAERAEGDEPLIEFASDTGNDRVVDPTPKLVSQFDPRWAKKILHSSTTWKSSGCHPCCVAMALRWIAEKNPEFPFPTKAGGTIPKAQHPLSMCEAFWPDLGGQVQSKGGKVDHTGLREKAEDALGMKRGSSLLSLSGDRLETVKKALGRGPVVVNMTSPGHFVVVHGYKGGRLLIADGGRELDRFWKEKGGKSIPTGVSLPSGGSGFDAFRPCFVGLDPAARYDYVGDGGKVKKSDLAFLETVICMESFYLAKKSI